MTDAVRLTSDLGDAQDENAKVLAYSSTYCIMAPDVQAVWRTAHDHVCTRKGDSLRMLFCHLEKDVHAEVGNPMDAPSGLDERVG
ncbi:hypothetical protein DL769_003203 [Monosporascus sp. CRB-8-3]|nr:hypothetical protein DL769_003203 [Monosporascus sp. CRB-8-3]